MQNILHPILRRYQENIIILKNHPHEKIVKNKDNICIFRNGVLNKNRFLEIIEIKREMKDRYWVHCYIDNQPPKHLCKSCKEKYNCLVNG